MSTESHQREEADPSFLWTVAHGFRGIYQRNRLAVYVVAVLAVVWTATSLTTSVSQELYPSPIYIGESLIIFQDRFIAGVQTTIIEILENNE